LTEGPYRSVSKTAITLRVADHTLLKKHRLRLLGIFLGLWVCFFAIHSWFGAYWPYPQQDMPVLGFLSVCLFGFNLKMGKLISEIVSSSVRFTVFRRILPNIDIWEFYRDGALLSILSATVYFSMTVCQPLIEVGFTCFSFALGTTSLLKFGYDFFITYKALRIEWGPSRAYKPRSTRSTEVE